MSSSFGGYVVVGEDPGLDLNLAYSFQRQSCDAKRLLVSKEQISALGHFYSVLAESSVLDSGRHWSEAHDLGSEKEHLHWAYHMGISAYQGQSYSFLPCRACHPLKTFF